MVHHNLKAALVVLFLVGLTFVPAGSNASMPTLEVTEPVDGLVTNKATIDVKGITDGLSVEVNGVSATLTGTQFSAQVSLSAGPNTILVQATDGNGNLTTKAISVIKDNLPPVLSVTEPASPLKTNKRTIQVSGKVEAGSSVTVDGNIAPVNGDSFSIETNVDENTTSIMVTARDAAGNSRTVTIPVDFYDGLDLNVSEVRDGSYHVKMKDWPKGGFKTYYDWVTVTGSTDPGSSVTVNDDPVEIGPDGSFKADTYLELGDNTITIESKDGFSNNMTINLNVERLDWEAPVVHVEIAGMLLILGLGIGTYGGMVIGRWRERKARDKDKEGKSQDQGAQKGKGKEPGVKGKA